MAIVPNEIADIPEDKPSKPSIKLIEFVIPTIQMTVTIQPIHPKSITGKNGK